MDARFQPPGFARPLVPPGFAPPPAPPPKKGLSTAAIVVIVVVAVVAATAVPAAVLYVLVSGLTMTGPSPPYELGMTVVGGSGVSGPHPDYYVNLSLTPTVGLSTGLFGLQVVNQSGGLAAPVEAPSTGCTYGARPATTACTSTGSGWYAALTDSTGSIVATYGGSGTWSNMGGGESSVPVVGGDNLVVVSGTNYTSGLFEIHAFGTGSSPVSGATEL